MPDKKVIKLKTLLEKLGAIQSELKAPKNQHNGFGNYNYRSCEDILEAVKPLIQKHGCTLFITDRIVRKGDRYYVEANASLQEDGNIIDTYGYAREAVSKKGMDESQITGAASSYARKYALNGLFLIDDTKDADTKDNTDSVPATATNYKTTKSGSGSVGDPIETGVCSECRAEVSKKVMDFSLKKHGKVICYDCQEKLKDMEKTVKPTKEVDVEELPEQDGEGEAIPW